MAKRCWPTLNILRPYHEIETEEEIVFADEMERDSSVRCSESA
jgi:hypothetical protein